MPKLWIPGDPKLLPSHTSKRKPIVARIDWSHPITDKLEFCWIGGEIDLVTGNSPSSNTTDTVMGPFGRAADLGSSSSETRKLIFPLGNRLYFRDDLALLTRVHNFYSGSDEIYSGLIHDNYTHIAFKGGSGSDYGRASFSNLMSGTDETGLLDIDDKIQIINIDGNLAADFYAGDSYDYTISFDHFDSDEYSDYYYVIAEDEYTSGSIDIAYAWSRSLYSKEITLLKKDPYCFLESIQNDNFPFLLNLPGATYEAYLSLGSELFIDNSNDVIFEASTAFVNSLGYSDTSNAVFEVSSIFSKSLSYIGESGNILDVAVVFSNELSSFYQDNAVFEAASNFLNSLSYSNNGGIVLDTSVDFNIVESDQFSSDVTFETAVSLSNLLANLFSTGNIFDSEVSFEMLQSVQATVSAILEAATIYSNAQGISEGNIASLNAVQDFGITQSVLLSSVADLSSDISFNISEDFVVDGELITSGIVDAYTVLAINQGIESQIGSTTYSPKLDVGIVQSIDSLTIANLFASSVFGSQLIFSTNGGNLIEAAISYGIVQQNIQSIDISIEGAVQFGIGQALSGNGQAEINGAIALSHQAAIQSIAQSVLDANLPLSCIQGIDVEGSLALLSLELPCGRSIKVRIESRSVSVQSENRTISVEPENRTISAQPENRNTTIRGCN